MYGLFNSNGPIYVDAKFGPHRRENPWSLTHSMLYIDSLVGAGRLTPRSSSEQGLINLRQFFFNPALEFFSCFILCDTICELFAGFSFTEDERGYARNSEDVARDLFSALVQFYQLFPDFQGRELFIAGEAYAGKMISATIR